jgi:hypothetical protein
MEDDVNKLICSAGALLAAVTMLSSTAEAGFKFRIGLGFPVGGGYSQPSYHAHRHYRERVYVERKAKRTYVAKKKTPSTIATVQKEDPADTVAVENENSSISVAALPANEVVTNPATTEDTSATPPQKDAAVAPTDGTVTNATETTASPIATNAPALPLVDQKAATPDVPGQKTAKKLDCKTFFPSVGLTLSVPCG